MKLIVTDPLDTVLLARWRDQPRYGSRLRHVVGHILDALERGQDCETYAQVRARFWYKVYFLSPHGALKCDTNGEVLETVHFARRIVHHRNLIHVPLSAVMVNWHTQGLWAERRPIAALL